MKVIIKYIITAIFLLAFAVSSYFAYKEFKIWIYGDNVNAQIEGLRKIQNDKYLIEYTLNQSSDLRQKVLTKKAYNSIKSDGKFRVRFLSNEEVIFLDLKSRNAILGFIIAVLVFGFLSWKALKYSVENVSE